MKKYIIALIGIVLITTLCRAETSVILKQTTAPLSITEYVASFDKEFESNYGGSHPDQIQHQVNYKNTSGKIVVALQIGFAVFDAFNKLMDGFNGWSIETILAGSEAKGEWSQRPYAAFSFNKYGTGVAYVKAVRFDDGTIWSADMVEVLTEMQKFEKDLKKEDLEEKKK